MVLMLMGSDETWDVFGAPRWSELGVFLAVGPGLPHGHGKSGHFKLENELPVSKQVAGHICMCYFYMPINVLFKKQLYRYIDYIYMHIYIYRTALPPPPPPHQWSWVRQVPPPLWLWSCGWVVVV